MQNKMSFLLYRAVEARGFQRINSFIMLVKVNLSHSRGFETPVSPHHSLSRNGNAQLKPINQVIEPMIPMRIRFNQTLQRHVQPSPTGHRQILAAREIPGRSKLHESVQVTHDRFQALPDEFLKRRDGRVRSEVLLHPVRLNRIERRCLVHQEGLRDGRGVLQSS